MVYQQLDLYKGQPPQPRQFDDDSSIFGADEWSEVLVTNRALVDSLLKVQDLGDPYGAIPALCRWAS